MPRSLSALITGNPLDPAPITHTFGCAVVMRTVYQSGATRRIPARRHPAIHAGELMPIRVYATMDAVTRMRAFRTGSRIDLNCFGRAYHAASRSSAGIAGDG